MVDLIMVFFTLLDISALFASTPPCKKLETIYQSATPPTLTKVRKMASHEKEMPGECFGSDNKGVKTKMSIVKANNPNGYRLVIPNEKTGTADLKLFQHKKKDFFVVRISSKQETKMCYFQIR